MSGPQAATRLRIVMRKSWRRLTSMRTALILLFLLAVAAVPGSLLPQRPLNPATTAAYIADHGAWGRFLDALGMFDVFGSIWFAAIYLLLFVSLIGCLIPRIRLHARAVVRKPLPAPRNLDRLPESAGLQSAMAPEQYAQLARGVLGRRWRITQRAEDGGAVTLSAEKGYSRETGNLVFHVALLVSLVLITIGRLYTYEGQLLVRQGQGFCNTIAEYDAWHPGRFAAEGRVRPGRFCITDLNKFTATYTAAGEPTEFRADVHYTDGDNDTAKRAAISVNHPLRLAGDRVYLITHGYAPIVTVHMPDGSTVRQTANFIPTVATTLFSEGAFTFPGKPAASGAKRDIGIAAFFAPTPTLTANRTVGSASAAVNHPILGIRVYEGDTNGTGAEQSIFALDTTKMRRIGDTANLIIGETAKFPDGVRVTFDDWTPWVSLQVSHDPAQGYLLFSAAAMVIGLIGSLGVRRRRVWLRIGAQPANAAGRLDTSSGASSPTVVSVGGLARSDSGNFTGEFVDLVERLQSAAAAHSIGIMHNTEDAEPARAGRFGAGKE